MIAVKTKVCTKCGETKEHGEYHKQSKSRDGLKPWCKTCSNSFSGKYYKENKSKVLKQARVRYLQHGRNKDLRSKYGISSTCYEKMWQDQGCKCAICGREREEDERHFPVDHCHDTGKVRAILCGSCNRGIGMLQDDPEVVQSAADYLLKHKEQ